MIKSCVATVVAGKNAKGKSLYKWLMRVRVCMLYAESENLNFVTIAGTGIARNYYARYFGAPLNCGHYSEYAGRQFSSI